MVYRRTARSEAVREAAQERILRAALKLFVEKGFDATTMKDIVAEAGTSIGNAYFYFASKDALVSELVESVARAMLEESERAAAAIPAGHLRLGVMIASRVESFISANRPMAQLLLDTDQRLGTIQIVEDVTIERWIPQLAACFPERSPEELPAIAAAIWGLNRTLVTRVARGRLELDRAGIVSFAVRWTLRALAVPEAEIESVLDAALSSLHALPRDIAT